LKEVVNPYYESGSTLVLSSSTGEAERRGELDRKKKSGKKRRQQLGRTTSQ